MMSDDSSTERYSGTSDAETKSIKEKESIQIPKGGEHSGGDTISSNIDFAKQLTDSQTKQLIDYLIPMCQSRIQEMKGTSGFNSNIETGNLTPRSNDPIGAKNNEPPRSNDMKGDDADPRTNVKNRGKGEKRGKEKKTNSKLPSRKKKKLDMSNSANSNDDQVSLHADSEIDERANKLISDSESSSTESSEEEFDLSKFKSDYLEDTEAGPSVDDNLADLFKALKDQGLSSEKLAAKAKEHPRPNNCNMETKKVNPEIWSNIITTADRNLDIQLQKTHTLLSKASYAMLKVADTAMSSKKDKKKRKDNLKSIIKNATDALAFAATAHKNNAKLRSELILKKLVREQRSIGKDVPQDDKFLFGDNLTKKLSDSSGINRLKPKKFKPHTSNYRFNKQDGGSKNFNWPPKAPRGRRGGYSHKSTFTQQKPVKKQ